MRTFGESKSVVVLLAVGALMLAACTGGVAGAPAAQPTPLPAAKANTRIVAEAVVAPVQQARLGLALGGRVVEAPVKAGDRVEAGQVIVRLETTDLENGVKKAEDGVKRAEAGVKRAEAGVKTAQAQLAKAKAPAREVDIAAADAKVTVAEAGVVAARARLAATQARAGDSQASVTAAQGRLAQAQAGLEKTNSGPTAEAMAMAERRIEQAKNSLWGAQAQRDAVCGRANDGSAPRAVRDAAQPECDAAKASVNSAEEGIRLAELELQQLKSGPLAADVKSAQASITQSQGDLAGARARAQAAASEIAAAETDITNAEANVKAARAELDRARAPATAEDIAVAEAGVNAAQTELAAAQVELAAAQTDLATARAELDKASLKAPFSGTIVSLDVKMGERVQAGSVVAQMADLSQWEIETVDLTELNVVRLKPGDAALVTFDAIPGLELPGTITRIGDLGENRQGDIVYKVTIKPDTHDTRLRWQMTASATFDPK